MAPVPSAAGRTTSYAADRMVDGDAATAWRMNGDGSGAVLTFALDGVHRVTRVTWIVDGHEHRQELEDGERGVQRLRIPAVTVSRVQLRIDATTAPGSATFDKTAVSDVAISG